MVTSRQVGLFLYSSMAFLHFMLGAINSNDIMILLSQWIGCAFWLYIASVEFNKE